MKLYLTGTMRSGTTLFADLLGRGDNYPNLFVQNEGLPLIGHARNLNFKNGLIATDKAKLEKFKEFGWTSEYDTPDKIFELAWSQISSIASTNWEKQGSGSDNEAAEAKPIVLGVKYTNLWKLINLMESPDGVLVVSARKPFDVYSSHKMRTLHRDPTIWRRMLLDIYYSYLFASSKNTHVIYFENLVRDKELQIKEFLNCIGLNGQNYKVPKTTIQNTSFVDKGALKKIDFGSHRTASYEERASIISKEELAIVQLIECIVWDGRYKENKPLSCSVRELRQELEFLRKLEAKSYDSSTPLYFELLRELNLQAA